MVRDAHIEVCVAGAALNQTPLDWKNNFDNILQAIEEAQGKGVKVLCLPELCLPGYGCEDAFLGMGVVQRSAELLVGVAKNVGRMIVAVGVPLQFEGELYNCAALICNRKILGFYAKQNLANSGVYYEQRWFKAWPRGKTGKLRLLGKVYPIGDLTFDSGELKIGFEICEDAWVQDRPLKRLKKRGVNLILNPSASHFSFGKGRVREQLVRRASRGERLGYIFANHLGLESGKLIFDGDVILADKRGIVRESPKFSFKNMNLIYAVLKLPAVRKIQDAGCVRMAGLEIEKRGASYSVHTQPGDALTAVQAGPNHVWEAGKFRKAEEFARASALGLFDYLRKSKAKGYVVSLSGGADSATVAALVYLMVQLGVCELGARAFQERLSHIAEIQGKSLHETLSALLSCVYQATQNSGKVTLHAAKEVARGTGAQFFQIKLDGIVSQYVATVSDIFGRTLNWARDDLALQNVQARSRAPGVWLLANLKQAILLCTSNRSEAAVGYATMDGDTCGGLSPIAGVDKSFIREWLRWLEKVGPHGLGPVGELRQVNSQAPTAELRPPSMSQADESDLMPYELLDAIERAAIRDRLPVSSVYAAMLRQFGKRHKRAQILTWVKKFYRLWSQNQWKRERYAPAFHLDDESLDPKTWCRFPILSGNFETELSELELKR